MGTNDQYLDYGEVLEKILTQVSEVFMSFR